MRKRRFLFLLVVGLANLFAACSDDLLEDSTAVEPPSSEGVAAFQWTRAEDVETREHFRRNFGLGYSYDAVRGSFCDWKDIRVQILNRPYMQELEDLTGEQVYSQSTSPMVSLDSKFDYSLRDYVANVALNSKASIDIGLYNKEKRQRQYFIEDGVQEIFFYTHDEKVALVYASVGYLNLFAHYYRYPNIFTMSFRNAVEHLKETEVDDIAAVDSFVNIYGTHVIVAVQLGGSLRVDLKNDMWRFNDKSKSEEWSTEEFLGEVTSKDVNRSTGNEYRWLEHSRLNLTARGGDQSSLTSLLGEHDAYGQRTFSLDGISAWRQSLKYDPNDELNSNVEMVDMTVVPIWEFAEPINHTVAQRIKAAVLQDASLQMSLLGDVNFFDVSFPMRYTKASCQWRKDTNTWQTVERTDSNGEPMVVNIMSGGRYVASVCHETINGQQLWVCYPIYDGKLNQAVGVGVADDGTYYRVRWLRGVPTLREDGKTTSQTFYINSGDVEVEPREGVNYPTYQALPYVEVSGGVRPDGSYAASGAYTVTKSNADFQLLAPSGKTDIVGFKDTKRTSGSNNVYQRDSTYTYIYNQNEIK